MRDAGSAGRTQLMGRLHRLTNARQPVARATRRSRSAEALQELESRNAAEMRKAFTALDEC
jgi:hypothetical protein